METILISDTAGTVFVLALTAMILAAGLYIDWASGRPPKSRHGR